MLLKLGRVPSNFLQVELKPACEQEILCTFSVASARRFPFNALCFHDLNCRAAGGLPRGRLAGTQNLFMKECA